VVICSQLSDNDNTSVTNMAECLAAEVVEEHSVPTPLVWIEHYAEHEGEVVVTSSYPASRLYTSWRVYGIRTGNDREATGGWEAESKY
jgi:hypothetical protein